MSTFYNDKNRASSRLSPNNRRSTESLAMNYRQSSVPPLDQTMFNSKNSKSRPTSAINSSLDSTRGSSIARCFKKGLGGSILSSCMGVNDTHRGQHSEHFVTGSDAQETVRRYRDNYSQLRQLFEKLKEQNEILQNENYRLEESLKSAQDALKANRTMDSKNLSSNLNYSQKCLDACVHYISYTLKYLLDNPEENALNISKALVERAVQQRIYLLEPKLDDSIKHLQENIIEFEKKSRAAKLNEERLRIEANKNSEHPESIQQNIIGSKHSMLSSSKINDESDINPESEYSKHKSQLESGKSDKLSTPKQSQSKMPSMDHSKSHSQASRSSLESSKALSQTLPQSKSNASVSKLNTSKSHIEQSKTDISKKEGSIHKFIENIEKPIGEVKEMVESVGKSVSSSLKSPSISASKNSSAILSNKEQNLSSANPKDNSIDLNSSNSKASETIKSTLESNEPSLISKKDAPAAPPAKKDAPVVPPTKKEAPAGPLKKDAPAAPTAPPAKKDAPATPLKKDVPAAPLKKDAPATPAAPPAKKDAPTAPLKKDAPAAPAAPPAKKDAPAAPLKKDAPTAPASPPAKKDA
ncbi:hypothetical protein ChUKH1_18395, partial [Cryptosporidium hominis]